VVNFVVESAKAYSNSSPYFDETATRSWVEADVARAQNIASTLTPDLTCVVTGGSPG
jgi:hypothetical protein